MVNADRRHLKQTDFRIPVRVHKDWYCHYCRRLIVRGSDAYRTDFWSGKYGDCLRACAACANPTEEE